MNDEHNLTGRMIAGQGKAINFVNLLGIFLIIITLIIYFQYRKEVGKCEAIYKEPCGFYSELKPYCDKPSVYGMNVSGQGERLTLQNCSLDSLGILRCEI